MKKWANADKLFDRWGALIDMTLFKTGIGGELISNKLDVGPSYRNIIRQRKQTKDEQMVEC